MEAENKDRWILVHALHGGGGMVRDKSIIEIRSVPCDDTPEMASIQGRPQCPYSAHHTLTLLSGPLSISRVEAERICGELGIDPGFLLPDEMPKPISTTAN